MQKMSVTKLRCLYRLNGNIVKKIKVIWDILEVSLIEEKKIMSTFSTPLAET